MQAVFQTPPGVAPNILIANQQATITCYEDFQPESPGVVLAAGFQAAQQPLIPVASAGTGRTGTDAYTLPPGTTGLILIRKGSGGAMTNTFTITGNVTGQLYVRQSVLGTNYDGKYLIAVDSADDTSITVVAGPGAGSYWLAAALTPQAVSVFQNPGDSYNVRPTSPTATNNFSLTLAALGGSYVLFVASGPTAIIEVHTVSIVILTAAAGYFYLQGIVGGNTNNIALFNSDFAGVQPPVDMKGFQLAGGSNLQFVNPSPVAISVKGFVTVRPFAP
jgi:hypothetical protein